jgi:ferredoxin
MHQPWKEEQVMAVRKIVRIDEDLCDGCGLCVPACAEGALQIVDGKARLVSEVFCDGLGACLGDCPHDAIQIEERDAEAFDEAAVEEHLAKQQAAEAQTPKELPCGCPGSALRTFEVGACPEPLKVRHGTETAQAPLPAAGPSALSHWPVQLMLIPPGAPFLKEADLLICADCVPFTVPDFHARYLQGKTVLVGCPKLDNLDLYRQKLAEIFAVANPRSVTVLRMEVPCCSGIAQAVVEARDKAAPHLDVEVHTMGIRGGSHVEKAPARARVAQGGA